MLREAGMRLTLKIYVQSALAALRVSRIRDVLWLAARGYEVHLVDPVPLHVEQARKRSAAETAFPPASIRQGDARRLECGSDQADVVLLFGPLYHLPARSDRLRALQEAWRVLRADGLVLVAAISRFASALDGLVSHFFADPGYAPTVWQDLTDGRTAVTRMGRTSRRRTCISLKSWQVR